MALDEFDFDGDASLIGSATSLSSPSKSSVSSSSCRNFGRTRTKRQRQKAKNAALSQSQQSSKSGIYQEEQDESFLSQESRDSSIISRQNALMAVQENIQEDQSTASTSNSPEKSVRFSLSPERSVGASTVSSLTTTQQPRRTKKRKISQDESSVVSSLPSCSQDSYASASFDAEDDVQCVQQQQQQEDADSCLTQSPRSSSSRSSSRTGSYRSSTSSLRRQRRRIGNSASTSWMKFHSQQLQEQHSTKPIRGAGIDAFAVQDAGSFRELFDDLSYKTSAISSLNSRAAAGAAGELALVMSSKKNRSILFAKGNTALSAVLDAVACASTRDTVEQTSDKSGENRAKTRTARKNTSRGASRSKKGKAELDSALASTVHFLSWDCTTNQQNSSSFPSAAMARNIRTQLLQHKGAMKGISNMIMADPIVASILPSRASATEGNESCELKPKGTTDPSKGDEEPPLSTERKNENAASTFGKSETPSPARRDPTSAGRRRKKRRRLLFNQESSLEPIPEQNEETCIDAFQGGCSQMSFTSRDDDDESSSMGYSPRKRSARRGDGDDDSSAASVNSLSDRIQNNLRTLRAKVVFPEETADETDSILKSDCARCSEDLQLSTDIRFPGLVSLDAMSRIIAGKEGDEVSCMDEEEENNGRSSQDEQHMSEEEEHARNPLLVTNRFLLESGCLPLLARAMAETLEAVLIVIREIPPCETCLGHLQSRVSRLASVIDGACCLSPENRRELCKGPDAGLIPKLLLVLKASASDRSTLLDSNDAAALSPVLDDIALSSIRTLTSLTHENHVAGDQLMHSYNIDAADSAGERQCGLSMLAQILYTAVNHRQDLVGSGDPQCWKKSSAQQHWYDLVIFCLNTLTNAVETKGVKGFLASLEISSISGETCRGEDGSFLTWLSRWLVAQTTTFRDAVMEGSFGQNTNSTDRDLERHEQEHLVTAGNGFILLACLMTESPSSLGSDATDQQDLMARIRSIILSEMQVGENERQDGVPGSSTVLIRNTLKAFCNFYHYSVGDLSVAVVAPVRKLIEQLEAIM